VVALAEVAEADLPVVAGAAFFVEEGFWVVDADFPVG
jgi:hypothetical protein